MGLHFHRFSSVVLLIILEYGSWFGNIGFKDRFYLFLCQQSCKNDSKRLWDKSERGAISCPQLVWLVLLMSSYSLSWLSTVLTKYQMPRLKQDEFLRPEDEEWTSQCQPSSFCSSLLSALGMAILLCAHVTSLCSRGQAGRKMHQSLSSYHDSSDSFPRSPPSSYHHDET